MNVIHSWFKKQCALFHICEKAQNESVFAPCKYCPNFISQHYTQVVPTDTNSVTSLLPCLMMESLQHEKQNLWSVFEGHCTKWVSSSLPRQFVHFNSGVPSAWVNKSGFGKNPNISHAKLKLLKKCQNLKTCFELPSAQHRLWPRYLSLIPGQVDYPAEKLQVRKENKT